MTEYEEGINGQLMLSEIQIRWFNDACYELVLPGGKEILIDPYIDNSQFKKLGSEAVKGADYILVSHVHFDHVMNIGDLSKKYNSKVFAGRSSAIELARYYNIPGYRMYPCAAGDVFEMEDFKLEVIYGKHTNMGDDDTPMGWEKSIKRFNLDEKSMDLNIYGSYEYVNYLITLKNNTKVMIWGGEASVEAINRARGYQPNISIVQIPRETAGQISDLYQAIGGELLFPHHHETILALEGGEQRVNDIIKLTREKAPQLRIVCPKKGVWYRIGTTVFEE